VLFGLFLLAIKKYLPGIQINNTSIDYLVLRTYFSFGIFMVSKAEEDSL